LESIEVKSAVETLEPTKVRLTVEVEYDELKPSIDQAYKYIADQVNVPGFRKGKVPPRIIDQRVGRGAVLEQAINESLGGFYSQAVNDTKLRPLGRPEVEVTKLPDVDQVGGTLEFSAEVEVRPEIELPALDGLAIEVDGLEVTDEDVEGRLLSLRERFGTLVGVDRPAADGDFVVIDLKAELEGAELDAVAGVSYQIGSKTMLEGLDEALVGLSAGETTTFEAPLVAGDHEGTASTITVTATQVKERELPAADDDFAQLASEFDTLDELRDDLRTQVASIKENNRVAQAREALLTELEKIEVPLPSGVIEDEVNQHLEGEGRLEDDEHRSEVTEQVTSALKGQIILDTLAEQLEVKVGQQELVQYLVSSAQQYGQDPNTFIQELDRNGQIPSVVAEVARNKALLLALREVAVRDASGADVDLSDFLAVPEDEAAADDEATED
jgi:trigger factor